MRNISRTTIILLILQFQITFSQDFRSSLRSEKLNENEWGEWEYNGCLFQIRNDNEIRVSDNENRTVYSILEIEELDSYENQRGNVIFLKCKTSTNIYADIYIVDTGINYTSDRTNPKYKLDRHRIYIVKDNTKFRYNVYLIKFPKS